MSDRVLTGALVLYGQSQLNIGDKFCSPALYHDLGMTAERDVRFAATSKAPKRALTIVGGGGVFRPQMMRHLRRLFSTERQSKVIVWGAGLNDHAKQSQDKYPDFVYTADLVGVRDWNKGLPWVPCATCSSLAFDKKRTATHEVVIYDHYNHRVPVSIAGAPRSNNAAHSNVNAVLDFLGQGDTVLTSSYHGVYWATLLGKKVVAWPFSSKFYFMKHPPVLADSTDWKTLNNKAERYPEALVACREVNAKYYRKVMGLANT